MTATVKSYIAEQASTGTQAAKGVLGFSSVYCPIDPGNNIVTVSWAGSAEIHVHYGPNRASTNGGYRVGVFPAGTDVRQKSFAMPSSAEIGSMWLLVQSGVSADLGKKIGIQIVNFEPTI